METNEDDKYYVVIHNRKYRHEYDTNDYHIEKIFSRDKILEIINSEVDDYYSTDDFRILTNDYTLLNRYLFTINKDELMMLCNIPNYVKNNIRINKDYYDNLRALEYSFIEKILNDEIISATMIWRNEIFSPYEYVTRITEKYFDQWEENKEFEYLKTPIRYRTTPSEDSVFKFKNYKIGNIDIFQKIVNINILEIGTDEQPNINWEWRNGQLRYYDKISSTRLYIHENLLNHLKNDKSLNFHIETKLDKNLYIEYYVTGIVKKEYDDDENIEYDPNNDIEYSTEKYNGAYGYDDSTIDSAFEGDPDNHWNID